MMIPSEYNYIAAFLTMRCNLHCSYCINRFGKLYRTEPLTGKEWVKAINKIDSKPDLPVTIQGGEPTQHPDFYYIINNIKPELNIDLMTNLQLNIYEFMENVKPDRIKRDAPYASIRVSFHPEQMDEIETASKIRILLNNKYSVGVWLLKHPVWESKNNEMKKLCKEFGIDCREKELLGFYDGKLYGSYTYPEALSGKTKIVECITTELLIGTNGDVYRCHSNLYGQSNSIGNILDDNFSCEYKWRGCKIFGECNPCDIKSKFNRFQELGHCSVKIREK